MDEHVSVPLVIEISVGRTVNTGNFNSVRADVKISGAYLPESDITEVLVGLEAVAAAALARVLVSQGANLSDLRSSVGATTARVNGVPQASFPDVENPRVENTQASSSLPAALAATPAQRTAINRIRHATNRQPVFPAGKTLDTITGAEAAAIILELQSAGVTIGLGG